MWHPLSVVVRCALGALVLLSIPGMTCGPSDPDPCELDRLGCVDPETPEAFYLDSCPPDVTGALEVEVGTGEERFEPFAAGAGPVVHYGTQGGQHVFMAFRVKNARLDLSPLLKFHFYLGQGGDACAPPTAGEPATATCNVTLGQRELVLGGTGFELHTNASGEVEEAGWIVFVSVPDPTVSGLIVVSVEDPCRRMGTAYQAWTRY